MTALEKEPPHSGSPPMQLGSGPGCRERATTREEVDDMGRGQEDASRTEEKNGGRRTRSSAPSLQTAGPDTTQALFCTCWEKTNSNCTLYTKKQQQQPYRHRRNGKCAILVRAPRLSWTGRVRPLESSGRWRTSAGLPRLTLLWLLSELLSSFALSTAIMTTGRQSCTSSQGCHYIAIHITCTAYFGAPT